MMERLWRWMLPGLAFQAVLIGGGYATGRELVSFYYPSGPAGGIIAMAITALIWSMTMMIVLEIARRFEIHDYRRLFKQLIGPGWIAFEVAYVALLVLVLSIVGAAAGEILAEMSGVPRLAGTSLLVMASTVVLLLGSGAVQKLLSYWSVVLYIAYVAFFVLFIQRMGDQSLAAFTSVPLGEDVVLNGLRYAGANINCFASILFLVAMLRTSKDSYIAGALVGPIAMIPGMLFYFMMMAFYPQIGEETVPLNFVLGQLELPVFKLVFQIAILGTLLQTGVGMVHALNERIDVAMEEKGKDLSSNARAAVALALMIFSITVAEWLGLVSLIDNGYGILSWVFIVLIFVPVFTIGLKILASSSVARAPATIGAGGGSEQ